MNPLLLSRAISLGSDLLQGMQSPAPQPLPAAPSAQKPFAELLAQAVASTHVKQAQWLQAKGIHSLPQAETRINALTEQLLQDPALHAATGASSAPFSLSILPDQSLVMQTDGGHRQTISGADPSVLKELTDMLSAVRGSVVGTGNQAATLRVHPGGKVSFLS